METYYEYEEDQYLAEHIDWMDDYEDEMRDEDDYEEWCYDYCEQREPDGDWECD